MDLRCGAPRQRRANWRNAGQFGKSVWPPLCSRETMSPSMSEVSGGGNLSVPRSFFPIRIVEKQIQEMNRQQRGREGAEKPLVQ